MADISKINLPDGSSYDIKAEVANKLGTSTVGSSNKPIYLNAGKATACSYTISKNVPSNAVFTDTKVTQQLTTENALYRVLLSSNASDDSVNGTVHKNGKLLFNPSLQQLRVGETGDGASAVSIGLSATDNSPMVLLTDDLGLDAIHLNGWTGNIDARQLNGVTIGSSPKFTDTNTTYSLTQDSTDGHKITLTPSSGTAQTVTIPDNNTTYSAGTGVTISGNNNAINVSYGTTATTACVGNDSRLSDARTPTSHTHGNIQNGGTLQTNDITIANGDKIVVTDSSDSSKIARTSIVFDGSTATKALTQKGTWETFGTSNLTIGTTSTTALKGDTKYAGASTAGGSATSAAKLDTASAGSATQPCYFANGVPSACTYSLNKTVPSDAVFTDTNNAVTQTATPSTNSDYEVLFSGTADNTTRTEGVRKNSNLTFNPLNGILTTGNVKADSYNALDSNGVNRLESYVDSGGAGRTNWYENTGYGTVTISGAVGDNIWLSDGTDNTTVRLNGETGKITCNSMNVQDISSSYTTSKSSGALGAATVTAYRTGNVVQMHISFAKNTTSSQSVGTNIWVGTISGGPLPINTISLMGYYSSAILQCQITSAGAVNVRIQGSAAQFTSASTVNGTFICADT